MKTKHLVLVVSFLICSLLIAGSVSAGNTESVTANNTVTSITLSGDGANINWDSNGYSAKGFKVTWSKNANPTYPTRSGDKYHYFSSSNQSSDTLTAFSGDGTYYVRVCEYLGSGKCGVYSNQITVTLGSGSSSDDKDDTTVTSADSVESITLSGSGSSVNWTVDGYSKKGFKVVWSKNANPTYPTRSGDKYHYYSSPNQSSDTLTAFDGSGAYYVRVCEYLGGSCGIYSNEISVSLEGEEKTPVACTMEYAPVCGVDGKTYGNKCTATAAGVAKAYYGECKEVEKDEESKKFEEKATKLYNNQLDEILSELKELRNIVKEQAAQIKYLTNLKDAMQELSSQVEEVITNFITYGVDENTKKLGEGERAAVMHSFKKAFNKLPETDAELEDAIRIANGRWPNQKSDEAENGAKEKFMQIYKRAANMDNPNDSAAVTVMAYGLRQKAENRNLASEKRGIEIFSDIFGYVPNTTEDWNIMQAITYSGATR